MSVARPHGHGVPPPDCRARAHLTVGEVVREALVELHEAGQRLERLAARLAEDPDDEAALAAYGELLQWATDHDLWDADRRADLVLAGLGLASAEGTGQWVPSLVGNAAAWVWQPC